MIDKTVVNIYDQNGNCITFLADQTALYKIFDVKNPLVLKKQLCSTAKIRPTPQWVIVYDALAVGRFCFALFEKRDLFIANKYLFLFAREA